VGSGYLWRIRVPRRTDISISLVQAGGAGSRHQIHVLHGGSHLPIAAAQVEPAQIGLAKVAVGKSILATSRRADRCRESRTREGRSSHRPYCAD